MSARLIRLAVHVERERVPLWMWPWFKAAGWRVVNWPSMPWDYVEISRRSAEWEGE